MSTIRIRALEPSDAEAINELSNCPGVIAGTLQLPFRSLEFSRERLAQQSPDLHRLVAEVDGRVVGSLGLHVETNSRRRRPPLREVRLHHRGHCPHVRLAERRVR